MKKILIIGIANPIIFFEYTHFKSQTDLKNAIGGGEKLIMC